MNPGGKAAGIARRTWVGLSIAAGVALVLWATSLAWGAALVLVVGSGLGAGTAFEAFRMGTLRDVRELWAIWAALLAAALTLWGGIDPGSLTHLAGLPPPARYWASLLVSVSAVVVMGSLAVLPFTFAGIAAADVHAAWRRWPRFLGLLLWLALPLPALFLVRSHLGVAGLGALILLSKVGDVAGYFAGNLLGKRFPHHPFPRVSPNKTSIGCWSSLITATAAGALLVHLGWLPPARFGLLSGLLGGALVNLGAQAGDLLESAAKRSAGVKDSSTLFGPSGGLLDLVDSLLLSVPMALLTWPALFEYPYPG